MKRFLGIILAVLGCAVYFGYLVNDGMTNYGFTLTEAILAVFALITITLTIVGFIFLVLWLLMS